MIDGLGLSGMIDGLGLSGIIVSPKKSLSFV
jgi:hypothetical protein